MGIFAAQELALWTGGEWKGPLSPPETLGGFCQDTRRLRRGEMFVALHGQRDGHDFVGAAAECGAGAALVERAVEAKLPQLQVDNTLTALHTIAGRHRQRFRGKVVGITGSAGKTSTKDLLWRMFGTEGTLRTEGNFNNLIGVPLTLSAIEPERHEWAVVEAGMNEPGEMGRLAAMIDADFVLVTTVAPAHLEKVGSMAGIAREKASLGHGARDDALVYFPALCLQYEDFRAFGGRARVLVREGQPLPPEAGGSVFSCLHYKTETVEGSRLRLDMQQDGALLFSGKAPLLSEGMIANAALAIWLAREAGVSEKQIQAALMDWKPSHLRGELLRSQAVFYYVDCYNANPASMLDSARAFDALFRRQLPLAYVLGSMEELGAEAEQLHEETAQGLGLQPGDRAIIVGEYAEAYARGLNNVEVTICADAAEAKTALAGFRGAVFVKGSRRWALETILPEELSEAAVREGGFNA